MKIGISEDSFRKQAKRIGCEVSVIKAVFIVESKGSSLLPNGDIKILFEPHVFWKELRAVNITPSLSDICYPKWGTKPYGRESEQHAKLQKAVKINRDAALKSASWGLFQILGTNYKLTDSKSIQDFINRMLTSEEEQLDMFVSFIMNTRLDDELVGKDWAGFARGYNGALYYKNQYDKKLERAYLKIKN